MIARARGTNTAALVAGPGPRRRVVERFCEAHQCTVHSGGRALYASNPATPRHMALIGATCGPPTSWTTAAPPRMGSYYYPTISRARVAASYAFLVLRRPSLRACHRRRTYNAPASRERPYAMVPSDCRVDQTPTPSKPPPFPVKGRRVPRAPRLSTLIVFKPEVLERPSRRSLRAVLGLLLFCFFRSSERFGGVKTPTEGLINSHKGHRPAAAALSISSQSTQTQLWPQPTKRTARGASNPLALAALLFRRLLACPQEGQRRPCIVRRERPARRRRRRGGGDGLEEHRRVAWRRRVDGVECGQTPTTLVGQPLVAGTWGLDGAGV